MKYDDKHCEETDEIRELLGDEATERETTRMWHHWESVREEAMADLIDLDPSRTKQECTWQTFSNRLKCKLVYFFAQKYFPRYRLAITDVCVNPRTGDLSVDVQRLDQYVGANSSIGWLARLAQTGKLRLRKTHHLCIVVDHIGDLNVCEDRIQKQFFCPLVWKTPSAAHHPDYAYEVANEAEQDEAAHRLLCGINSTGSDEQRMHRRKLSHTERFFAYWQYVKLSSVYYAHTAFNYMARSSLLAPVFFHWHAHDFNNLNPSVVSGQAANQRSNRVFS